LHGKTCVKLDSNGARQSVAAAACREGKWAVGDWQAGINLEEPTQRLGTWLLVPLFADGPGRSSRRRWQCSEIFAAGGRAGSLPSFAVTHLSQSLVPGLMFDGQGRRYRRTDGVDGPVSVLNVDLHHTIAASTK